MKMRQQPGQAGFSLVEMLVAVVVTTIVAGAIYGLLADSQSGFRREPERTDRQQNIRAAMDSIMRDIANAGSGMPAFMQVFTPNLDAPAGAPMGLANQITDELEIIANDGSRDNEAACSDPGGGSSQTVRLVSGVSTVAPNTRVMLIFEDNTWTYRNIMNTGTNNSGADNCKSGVNHVSFNVQQGGDTTGTNPPGGICKPSANGFGNAGALPGVQCPITTSGPGSGPPCCVVASVGFAEVVHYRIRMRAETLQGGGTQQVPQLERSASLGPWQVVARGIEDMQVQYRQANGTVTTGAPGAPVVALGNFGSVITEVTVTLSSRSMLRGRLQGETTDATGGVALRGSLTSSGTPRSALVALTQAPQASPSPAPVIWQ
jgi:prepilin-type N-terminal cleavage/methylation domain-containing protein